MGVVALLILAAALPQAGPLVTIGGFAQVDGVVWDQSSTDELSPLTGEPLNDTRFLLRRARLQARVERSFVFGQLDLEASTFRGPQLRLLGVEAAVRGTWKEMTGQLGMGVLRTPFGREVLQPARERFFLERVTAAQALFPGAFDAGLRGRFSWRFLRAELGLMNGEPIGEQSFPLRDPNRAKDVVGRLGVDVTPVEGIQLLAGFSGLSGRGFHAGTTATKDQLVWRDTNEDGIVQVTELQVIAGSAAGPSRSFRRFAMGADATLTWISSRATLTASAELFLAQNLDRGLFVADPVVLGRPVRERGFTASLTATLPYHLLAGVRYDTYNPDADASEQRALVRVPVDSSLSTISGLVGVGDRELGRLLLEYDHRDNAYGRAPNGAPTRLADDSLTVRAEVVF